MRATRDRRLPGWIVGLLGVVATLLVLLPSRAAEAPAPSDAAQLPALDVAFHYGSAPPFERLRVFDVVVVDPDEPVDPVDWERRSAGRSRLYAYTSIGEIDDRRRSAARIPADIATQINPAWRSRIVDPADPRWPELFVAEVIEPAWQRGFRGFFLDTMDAYHALPGDEARAEQRRRGLVRTIALLRERHPQARLIANRGFELLPRIAGELQAVAAESLYGRWRAVEQRYDTVPADDRAWLLGQLREVQQRYRLPAIAIEYADPTDRDAARRIARRVIADGLTPWVGDSELSSVGVGALDPVPRRVLLLHDGSVDGDEHVSPAQRLVAMPLQYLGFAVDLHDIRMRALPSERLSDRYAAVVGWFGADDAGRAAGLPAWIGRVLDERLKLVFLNGFGTPLDVPLAQRLGLRPLPDRLASPLRITARDPIVGFEFEPAAHRGDLLALRAADATPLLRLADARGVAVDGAAVTRWGGFALSPFTVIELPGTSELRWVIDPIEFLRRTLVDPSIPVADPTTATGRRVLMAHIDGDGFPSRAELPGSPWAAEVLLTDVLQRYRLPHTVSVIEADVAANGLYPQWSSQLEPIARRMFALGHVEIASHSYSHPFVWRAPVAPDGSPRHLPVPGYRFDLDREIAGSAKYIDTRLAPPGKKTVTFLWSGDCVLPPEAIARAEAAGLAHMNGGDTTITRRDPTLTRVAAMSIRKGGQLQVFAPNQNENVYTNNWGGPFYGFERVIETFELTESPRRIKPIDIYYHVYSASKQASLSALHKVYRWAATQDTHPMHVSQWVRVVRDFESLAIARDLRHSDGWRFAGDGWLSTLRVPASLAARVDWTGSAEIAGSRPGADGHYLHLSAPIASIRTRAADAPADTAPRISSANGSVDRLNRTGSTLEFRLRSHLRGEMTLVHHRSCRTSVDGRPLIGTPIKKSLDRHPESGNDEFLYRFPDSSPPDGGLVSVRC